MTPASPTSPTNPPRSVNPPDAAPSHPLDQLAALVQDKAQDVARRLPMLGFVTWLLTQQQATRQAPVGQLVDRTLPPLALEQAKLYLRGGLPMAFATWAMLSDDAALRFRQSPHHLAPGDWRSGDQVWLVDVVAPFDGAGPVLQDLCATALAGRRVHALGALRDGMADVVVLAGGDATPTAA